MSRQRAALLVLFGAALAAAFWFGLDDYLNLEAVKRERAALVVLWHREPKAFAAAFVALNVAALALSLPGAVLSFGLAAGAIFGPVRGTALALAAVVMGDSLAFLIARYVVRDWLEQRFARHVKRANAGIARDGAVYLLALRLMAVVPYFVVNLTMGLTRLRLRIFAPVSLAGLIPVIFLYVQAGTELARIERLSDIYSPALLVTLALLGLLPLAARLMLRRRKSI